MLIWRLKHEVVEEFDDNLHGTMHRKELQSLVVSNSQLLHLLLRTLRVVSEWLNVFSLLQKPDKQVLGSPLLTRISEEIAIVHGIVQAILTERINLNEVQSGPPLDNKERG